MSLVSQVGIARDDAGVSSYCMRFRRSIAFAHPFPHRGRLGITETVPLDRIHPDDRATLREATGAADDAALVACFSRSRA